MPDDKSSLLRHPDGRFRPAVYLPVLFVLFAVIAILWQSGSGHP